MAASRNTLTGDITRRLVLIAGIVLLIQFGAVTQDIWSGAELYEHFHEQAAAVAEHIEDDGGLQVRLPADIEALYRQYPHAYAYDIHDHRGVRLTARNPEGLPPWNATTRPLPAFWVTPLAHANRGPEQGLTRETGRETESDALEGGPTLVGLRWAVAGRPVWIRVMVAENTEDLLQDIAINENIEHLGALVLLIGLSLVVSVWSVRRALQPLQRMARAASRLDASRLDAHPSEAALDAADLPEEVAVFVRTINAAFGRIAQVLETQKAFTAAAAHELRTPLSILTLALDRADRLDLPRLRTDVAQMSRLVDQLLALARLDAQGLDLAESVDLSRLTQDVVARLAPWVIDQGFEIAFTDHGAPPVLGNRDALESALSNLIDNAVHHAGTGCRIQVEAGPGGRLVVEDSGSGIAEADRERIFDTFQRGTGKGGSGGGSGIGLAVVRRIAEAHGGAASVGDSVLGGAAFLLTLRTLPAAPASPAADMPAPPPS